MGIKEISFLDSQLQYFLRYSAYISVSLDKEFYPKFYEEKRISLNFSKCINNAKNILNKISWVLESFIFEIRIIYAAIFRYIFYSFTIYKIKETFLIHFILKVYKAAL